MRLLDQLRFARLQFSRHPIEGDGELAKLTFRIPDDGACSEIALAPVPASGKEPACWHSNRTLPTQPRDQQREHNAGQQKYRALFRSVIYIGKRIRQIVAGGEEKAYRRQGHWD